MPRLALAGAFLIVSLLGTSAWCQQPEKVDDKFTETQDPAEWPYGQSYAQRPDPKDIIHQKAQARAYQRMARMASMRWYGMSNERPTASPMPFTTMYSPGWQMPGGRPYAWYQGGWASSSIIIQR